MGPFEFPAWDPVLLPLPGPIDVRWYGLMYIVGFVSGGWILGRLARRRFLDLDPERVADLIFYAVVGTILGGRLGFALFYDQGLFTPLRLVRLWEGGLAFHGGLLGVIVALWIFARRHRLDVGRVLDAAALAVTPGIFAVRVANFINGELYGRVTDASSTFAMRFPTDEYLAPRLGGEVLRVHGGGKRAEELMIQHIYGKVEFDAVLAELDRVPEELPPELAALRGLRWEDLQQHVPFRHPSQLYEACGEGLLLGLVMWVLYRATRARPLQPWTYGGVFVLGYGVVRTILETFRQPDRQFRTFDDQLGTVVVGLTMGQVLSSVMIVGGAFLVVRGVRQGRRQQGRSA